MSDLTHIGPVRRQLLDMIMRDDRYDLSAAELDPSDGRWPYLLGHHRVETDPESAVGWLERAARGNVPSNAQETVRARLADALFATGRPADALTALGTDLKSPRIRLLAARAAAATGDDRAAAEYLGDLTEYPLSARQALLLRAEICRRQGRIELRPGTCGKRTVVQLGLSLG